jgi:hypothetical protein
MAALEGTWELAESEELLGDSLFFGGEPGSVVHYRAAQRALLPLGVIFSSRDENDRRMEAFQRVAAKLYAIGADGKATSSHDCKAHPQYVPTERKAKSPSEPADEIPVLHPFSAPKTRLESELGKLLSTGDWWANYRLGALWLEAAKILAASYPTESRAACEWSLEHFRNYTRDWTAHLPASRWDSDGDSEMAEANSVRNALTGETPLAPPDWVCLLLAGDWRESLAALERNAIVDGFQSMVEVLAEACKVAGHPDAAQRITRMTSTDLDGTANHSG